MPASVATTADQARRGLRERERQAQARGRERAERLRARVPEAARILRELGASPVLVLGSVARDEARDDSDLDLAVEGLSVSR